MPIILCVSEKARERKGERGAALISVLLISMLLLAAGGAVIMTTALSATTSISATDELQAYYAAQSGLQATLNVFRGNIAPNPLIDTSSTTAAANKISFRKAVTASTSNVSISDPNGPRLSRWLSYDSTYTDRVIISPPPPQPYSPLNGLAYGITSITDPDNSSVVTFSTSGAFDNGTTIKSFGSGQQRATLTYTAQASTTITNNGSSTLGYFTVSGVGNQSYTLSNEPFTLTITQTAPWPVTVNISCTLSGTFTGTSSDRVSVSFPTLTDNLGGAVYARSVNPVLSGGSTSPMSVAVTAPEPNRLVVKVTGFGPRGARKQLQMILNRFAFDYTPTAAITLRGSDTTGLASIAVGSSSQYGYTGNDNAGGASLPGFAVTNSTDYAAALPLMPPTGSQITGNPAPLSQLSTSNLSTFLQSADNARALVNQLRVQAQNENRYFTTSTPPSDFGATSPNGLLTFVDGDVDLPPQGGAGLLVVTGTLTMRGSAAFNGVILVLGGGQLIRDGGGNGNTLGSVVVASFGSTGGFTAPTFNSNGSGTSNVSYDSDWTRRALTVGGPRIMGVSEY